MRIIFLLISLSACNPFAKDNDDYNTVSPPEDELSLLSDKRDLYLELSKGVQDAYGFVESIGDGLTASCIYLSVGGDVDIFQARDETNRWWRHPSIVKNWNGVDYKSSISRDPLL